MTSGHGPDDAGSPRTRRRRRATGGRAPDPELAVADPVLRSLPGAAPEDEAEQAQDEDRARKRWLEQQRPPHWG